MCNRLNWESIPHLGSFFFIQHFKLLLGSSCSNLRISDPFKLSFSIKFASNFANRVLLRIVDTLVSRKLLGFFNRHRLCMHDCLFLVKAAASGISM